MGKRTGAGRKSLEEKLDESIIEVTIRIPESQKEFLKSLGGIAPGARLVIAYAMATPDDMVSYLAGIVSGDKPRKWFTPDEVMAYIESVESASPAKPVD